MYIALAGTPGTGKSASAEILATRGFTVITVENLAREHDAIGQVDGDLEVDTEKLAMRIEDAGGTAIIEGHLAHFLPNTVCIILRCHPEELRRRLSGRKYPREKLLANLEAEAVDIILTEALEMWENVFEIDTSNLRPEDVADAIESIINGKVDGYSPGKIDWSGAVMDWY